MLEPPPDESKPTNRPELARRRFTLLDGIILVAASAVGLKGHQVVAAVLATSQLPDGKVGAGSVIRDIRQRGFLNAPVHVTYWFEAATPWLVAVAFALLALRLIPPRPPWARLARRRGFLAIATTSGSTAATWLAWLVVLMPLERVGVVSADLASWSKKPIFYLTSLSAMAAAGAAVAVAWLMAWLLGRSRGRADWVDRAGVVLGMLMIASTPFYLWISLLYR